MKNVMLYLHGKGGSADEAARYQPLFPAYDVRGFAYRAETPWQAREEFPRYFDSLHAERVSLIANSIGAYFALYALWDRPIETAYLISPVADMEKLIVSMLAQAGATERQLREKGELLTPSGETLSWEYLSYVRAHPLRWRVPTHILYGENDFLTDSGTMSAFAEKLGATLTVMPGGEHWFHTEEQLAFLDNWLQNI